MATQIRIDEGTIVGRVTGSKVETLTLSAAVYVEAARDENGCWVYVVGNDTYICAGGLAEVC